MFRKIALGLFAAASLTAASMAPASAHGFHGHWGGGHWGNHFFNSSYYVGSNNCYERVVVQTRHGARIRLVNTCGYIY